MDSLYLHSPIWFQQIMVAVYGAWWYQRRFGKNFNRLVADFKSREHWSSAQFAHYQHEQLARLLEAAWHSPHYAQIFTAAGVTLSTDPWEALSRLPPLAKETLRQRPKDLLTVRSLPRGTLIHKSSGTTGTPTDIYYSAEFHALELAVPEVRNLNWAGVSSRQRRVMFGVRKVCNYAQSVPPFWRYSPRENMAYASIYHLAPRFIPHYLKFLRQYKPAIIMGYPNALNLIATYALENSDYPAPAKAIFTPSETLTENIRKNLETAWKCKIYDRYGAVENCMFAAQCEYGSYHVSPDVGIIEIVDAHGQPCKPGVLGQVWCTGLHNILQPLIRYQIGDVARWSLQQNCPCGRDWPILEGIEGRYEDICLTQDGRQVVRFDTVFKGVEAIKEAQVIQEALERFVIRVVPTSSYTAADTDSLLHNMKKHVGAVDVEIQLVDAIPRTPSGKFKAVISKLHAER